MTSPDPGACGPRRRIFRRRRRPDPEPAKTRADIAASDLAPWPGLHRLQPVTEDERIQFGRELEAAADVVAQLLAEC